MVGQRLPQLAAMGPVVVLSERFAVVAADDDVASRSPLQHRAGPGQPAAEGDEEKKKGGAKKLIIKIVPLLLIAAAFALFVLRTSISTAVRSLRPFGTNSPLGIRLYFVKCRGWHSAGLPPQ